MGQFQVESMASVSRTPHTDPVAHNESSRAAVASLLAGLSLRGHLCDSEKELLDRLAAHHSLVFLVLGDQYVHPDEIELVPVDQLAPVRQVGADAVFSHRHHLSDELGRKSQTIRTAQVGQIDEKSLVLGMIGPELPELRTRHDSHFGNLVQLLRSTLLSAEPLVTMLQRRLSQPDATIIVNRSSGRILALNPAARDLVAPAGDNLVGVEYTQVKSTLIPHLTKGRVSIENRSDSLLSTAIITVSKRPTIADPARPPVAAGFLQSMRHKTSGIASVARHLYATLGQEPGHAITELLQIIMEESSELDRQVWRHQLLTEYPKLRRESINPVAELRKALENSRYTKDGRQIALFEELSEPTHVSLPRQALTFLYEAILQLHCNDDSCESTQILVQAGDKGQGVAVTFVTKLRTASVSTSGSEWRDYCDRLSDTMGLSIQHHESSAPGTMETVLTITV